MRNTDSLLSVWLHLPPVSSTAMYSLLHCVCTGVILQYLHSLSVTKESLWGKASSLLQLHNFCFRGRLVSTSSVPGLFFSIFFFSFSRFLLTHLNLRSVLLFTAPSSAKPWSVHQSVSPGRMWSVDRLHLRGMQGSSSSSSMGMSLDCEKLKCWSCKATSVCPSFLPWHTHSPLLSIV